MKTDIVILKEGKKAISDWHGHEGLTPEANEEIGKMACLVCHTLSTLNPPLDEGINIVKVAMEAAFQLGRAHSDKG